MASTPRAVIGWKAFAAALAAAGCMGFSNFALPAPAWVKNALSLGRADQLHATPKVAKFLIDGGGAFVLDRSHNPALLKFEDGPEVWVVVPSRGPRGDILFKDDVGDILLRATKLGGMTAFTSRRPSGSAATLAGATSPLRLAPLGPAALYQRMVFASGRCTHASHHLVGFEAPDADPKSAALIADTAWLAMDAIVSLAGRSKGSIHVSKVILVSGAKPAVWVQHAVLVISVAPNQGLSGHPSSARIARVIEGP